MAGGLFGIPGGHAGRIFRGPLEPRSTIPAVPGRGENLAR
jgi:hypothetical protein